MSTEVIVHQSMRLSFMKGTVLGLYRSTPRFPTFTPISLTHNWRHYCSVAESILGLNTQLEVAISLLYSIARVSACLSGYVLYRVRP
jgi:hypothetical protein